MIQKIKKDEKEYLENSAKAKAVSDKKKELESMTIRKLTIMCKPLKTKDDGKMTTKKSQLVPKYKEWSGRPTPSFDISHLLISCNNRSDSKDNGTGNNNKNADSNITAV